MERVSVERNFYDVLGVNPHASVDDIRETYRRLMQHSRNHPDLGGDATTAALINKAYAVLKDPQQRRDYDLRLDILQRVSMGFADEPERKTLDPSAECLFCERPFDTVLTDTSDVGCDQCGSPVGTVQDMSISATDQRAVQRLDKQLKLTFFTHWQQARGYAARTEDLSPHGLRMVTRSHVRVGQRIRLVSNVLDAVGDVTHCVPRHLRWRTENVAGVAFLTLRFARSVGGFVSRRV